MSQAATTATSNVAADPLDPSASPFGSFAPPARLMRLRALAINPHAPNFVRRQLRKVLAHLSKKRGIVLDMDYLGRHFRLYLDENGQDRWVFRRGRHPEEDELKLFDRFAGRDWVFLDIGANNGYFAVMAGTRLGAGAKILSFEPHPTTFRKLLAALSFNNVRSVEPINTALGPEDAVMTLRVADAADGCNTLVGGSGAGVDVQVTPLASVLAARGIEKVDLLKIDVEGFEDQVLAPFFAAAPDSLWPDRVIIERTNRDRSWREDCFALLAARGYRIVNETMDNAWLVRQGVADDLTTSPTA